MVSLLKIVVKQQLFNAHFGNFKLPKIVSELDCESYLNNHFREIKLTNKLKINEPFLKPVLKKSSNYLYLLINLRALAMAQFQLKCSSIALIFLPID